MSFNIGVLVIGHVDSGKSTTTTTTECLIYQCIGIVKIIQKLSQESGILGHRSNIKNNYLNLTFLNNSHIFLFSGWLWCAYHRHQLDQRTHQYALGVEQIWAVRPGSRAALVLTRWSPLSLHKASQVSRREWSVWLYLEGLMRLLRAPSVKNTLIMI